MMSYIGTSQDLIPKIQQLDNEKYYCFTIAQSRTIAQLLEQGKFNDSLVNSLSEQAVKFEHLVIHMKSMISFQSDQIQNYEMIMDNTDNTIVILETQLKRKDRKLKRGKLQKLLLGISLVGLTTVVITK